MVTETPVLDDLTTRALAARDGDARTYAKAVHRRKYEPYQDAWAEALETRNRTVIVCPPDTYKALDLETHIPTPTGWQRLGDLKVGDVVFDEHGQPTQIIGVSPIWGDRPCYEVTFGDGTSIVADAEHLWFTRTRQDLDDRLADEKTERRAVAALLRGSTDSRIGTHKPRVRTPDGSVKTTEELATTVRIPNRGGWNHHIPVNEAVEYPSSHLIIAPYTLGAWLGDGHSANGRITNTDFEVWDSIVRDGYKLSDHELMRTVYGLHPELRELGLLDNKHIPKCYLQASVEARWNLLQGLMDTDGSPGKSGCIFVNTSERLAYGVLELARSLGLVVSIKEYEATLDGVYVSQKWYVTFPVDLNVFRIQRKRQIADRPGPKRQGKSIVAVTSVGSRPVRCISVDNPTGLFLAGEGFTPTHNSTTVRDFVEREIGKNPNVRILWLMNTGEQAQKQVMAISQTIQSNNVYRAAFGVQEDTELQWTKNVLFVERDIEDPDPTLMGTGLNGPYQGLHFNIIIIDDPTDQDDVKSPTTMMGQVEKIRGVVIDRLMEKGNQFYPHDGRIVVILTRWGQNDLVPTFIDMGFCLVPETKVLKADLTWVSIGSLVDGDELIGIDETPPAYKAKRKMRRSRVTSTRRLTLPCFCVTFSDGRQVVASGEHPWLLASRSGCHTHKKDWIATSDLSPGCVLRDIGEPWEVDDWSRDGGYLAGFLDGEGHVSAANKTVQFSQNEGVTLNTALAVAERLGFPFIRTNQNGKECFQYRLEDSFQKFRLLGSVRPVRLLDKAKMLWDGHEPPVGSWGTSGNSHAEVVSVEPVGEREVVGLTTDTHTFIAEGIFSHNTVYEMPVVGNYPWGPTLSPTKFPMERIERIREVKHDILFALTFMCNPQAVKGNIILRDHIQYWDAFTIPKHPMQFVMGIDPAASTRTYADNSAVATLGIDLLTKWMYLADMWAGRVETPDLEAKIVTLSTRTAGLRAVGLETAGFQLSLLQGMRRRYQLPFKEIPYRTNRTVAMKILGLDRDKTGRALYLDSLFASGRLFIPKDLPLVDGVSLEDELCSFSPTGSHRHDDRLDALAIACVMAESLAGSPALEVSLRGF